MNEYTPIKPIGRSPKLNFDEKIHDFAVTRRRALSNAGALVTQTTQGVIIRPKPSESSGGGGGDRPVWL